MTEELKAARTAMREAQLRAEEAKRSYDQAPTPKPDALRAATAKSDAEVMAALDTLRESQAEQRAVVDQLRAEIVRLGLARERAPDAPTTRPADDVASDAEKTAEAGESEANEAVKALAKGLATALCVTNPELCPVIAAIAEALGLFGSVPGHDLIFTAVSKVASGQPLTPELAAALFDGMRQTMGRMSPEATKLLFDAFTAGPDKAFKNHVDDKLAEIYGQQPGPVKAMYDAVKAGARGDPATLANDVKGRLAGGEFPSLEAKGLLLAWAAYCGATAEVLAALTAIPHTG